ncbi:MAG: FUSC family protein, partial [Verrucomicrobia bacterium]|nr:FUSC family protein [Verrucomicrobiota bacterium]
MFAIPGLVAAGALSTYLVVILLSSLPFMRNQEVEAIRLRARFLPCWRDAESATIALRVVVAVATAGLLSVPFGAHRSYWVVMVAGAVLQAGHVSRSSAARAMHRVLGTLLGVAIFGLINLGEPRGLWLVVVLALLQFAIEVV